MCLYFKCCVCLSCCLLCLWAKDNFPLWWTIHIYSLFYSVLMCVYTHLGEKTIWGAVVLCQDEWRHRVAVLKFRIVGKVRFEKLDLLLVDVAWLDGREDAGLLAVVHLAGRRRLDHWRRFGAGGSWDAQVPELQGRAGPRGQSRAHDGHASRWLGHIGVAAREDRFLLWGFTVSLCWMHLLTGNGGTFPFARRSATFGFGLGSLAGRLLGALGLLRLQEIVLAAHAEEIV